MTYRVTGNMAGCVYLSFTVELGSADGGYSTQTAGVLRDADFDIARRRQLRGLLRWSGACGQLAGAAGGRVRAHRALLLRGSRAGGRRPEPARPTDDRSARAARVRRRRGTTRRSRRVSAASPRSCATARSSRRSRVNASSRRGSRARRTCSRVPSSRATSRSPRSTPPTRWRRTLIAPDEALVITGRWPQCRFANVALWNRYLQTYDFAYRPAGRNRANTHTRGRWQLPHGPRPRGSGRAELDRHRGSRFRPRVLALLHARRRRSRRRRPMW